MMQVHPQPLNFADSQGKPAGGGGAAMMPEFPFDALFGTAQASLHQVAGPVAESQSVQKVETTPPPNPASDTTSRTPQADRGVSEGRESRSRSSESPLSASVESIAKWIQANPAGVVHGLGAMLIQNIRQVAKVQVVPHQPVPTFRFEVTEAFSDPLQIDIRQDKDGYRVLLASSGELQSLLGQNMNALAVFLSERLPGERIRLVLEEQEPPQQSASDGRQGRHGQQDRQDQDA